MSAATGVSEAQGEREGVGSLSGWAFVSTFLYANTRRFINFQGKGGGEEVETSRSTALIRGGSGRACRARAVTKPAWTSVWREREQKWFAMVRRMETST